MAYNYLGSPRYTEAAAEMAFYVYDAAGSFPNMDWEIDWGDGSAHQLGYSTPYAFLSHAYAVAGTYTITLTTTVGGVETATVHVTAPSAHIYSPNFSDGVPLYTGVASSFSVGSDGEATHLVIDWGDGSADFAGDAPYGTWYGILHTYAVAGSYDVVVTVTNSRGTASQTLTVPVVDIPEGGGPTNPITISGASGTYTTPSLTDFPTPEQAAGDRYPSDSALEHNDHAAWLSWTAPRKGVLVVDAVALSFQNPALEANRQVGDTLLRVNDASPDWGTFQANTCQLGFPVQAGVTYLIAVGNNSDDGPITIHWGYQQRKVGGKVIFLQYGFDASQLSEVVSLADPTKHECIAWQGGGSYHSTGDVDEQGRQVISADRLEDVYSHHTYGDIVIEKGEWAQPIPSVYESSSALYLDRVGGEDGYRGFGLTYLPGTQNVSNFSYDDDGNYSTIDVVPPTGAKRRYMIVGSGGPPTEYVGDTWYRRTPNDQHGEFFLDPISLGAPTTMWMLVYRQPYYWAGSHYNYGGGNAEVWAAHYALHDDTMTATLLEEFDPHLGEDVYGYFRAHAICHHPGTHTLLVSMEKQQEDPSGYQSMYTGGIFIRRFQLSNDYGSTPDLVDDFEYRPFPTLPKPSIDSEPGWRYSSFYAQGYMVIDPNDDDYFFMTNNGTKIDDDSYDMWSFVFRIPLADTGGDRHAAMREPWAQYQHPSGGEIYNLRVGELPAVGGGWAVGRVN